MRFYPRQYLFIEINCFLEAIKPPSHSLKGTGIFFPFWGDGIRPVSRSFYVVRSVNRYLPHFFRFSAPLAPARERGGGAPNPSPALGQGEPNINLLDL